VVRLRLKKSKEDGMGGTSPVTNYDYGNRDIVEAKLAAQRAWLAEQRREAERQARENTERTRKQATKAQQIYNGKVEKHKQQWYQSHGRTWNQEAWWKDWSSSKEGQDAIGELAPHITAYSTAAQNELLLAADQSPAALQAKTTEITGRDGSGSPEDKALDEIVAGTSKLIAHQSPELRTASQNYQLASAAWAKVQDDPNASGYKEAQTAFFDAQATYFSELNNTLDRYIQKGLKAGQKPEQIRKDLNEIFGEDLDSLIGLRLDVAKYGPQVDDLVAKFKANPNDPGFSPVEKALAEKGDFHTLAFLRLSKVQFGKDGSGTITLTIDNTPVPLSKEEQQVAEKDPLVLVLLKLGKVSFSKPPNQTGNNFLPEVTVETKEGVKTLAPGQLPRGALDAWKEAGEDYTGFAMKLLQLEGMAVNPDIEALMGATSQSRLDWTTVQVGDLMNRGNWREAQKVLKTNMDAAFSLEERTAIWQQAGLPHFSQSYIDGQIDTWLKMPDGTPLNAEGTRGLSATTMYGDRVGLGMQDFLKNATPELASLVLDRTMAKFSDKWYGSNEHDSTGALPRGKELFKGLSMAVGLNPQRADEAAGWLTNTNRNNPAGTFLNQLQGSANGGMGFESLRLGLKEGADPTLAAAVLEKMRGNQQFSGQVYEYETRFNQGTDGKGAAAASAAHRDFNVDPTKRAQAYFDHFLDDPNMGRPIPISDRTELRNIAGRAMGFAPNINLPQATKGDTSVSWYAEDSREYQVADLIATWIFNQGGANPTVTASPSIIASKQGGVQYGALFAVTGTNGQKVVIDGNAADLVVSQAEGNPLIDTDDQKVNPWQANVNWHYTNFKQFQEDNAYSDEGMIYFIGALNGDDPSFTLDKWSDDKGKSHVRWASSKAAITTTGEKWKTVGNFAAMGVLTVGGVLLALPSGGTSLTLVGAGLTIGGLAGMGALTAHDLNQMSSHGQSISWSNPAARSMYINMGAMTLSGVTAGLGTATKLTALSGTRLAQGGNTVLAGQRFQTAQTLGGVTRPLGYTDAATGVGLTGGQTVDMVQNWDQMTEWQKFDAVANLGVGLGGMVTGGAAIRIANHRYATRPNVRTWSHGNIAPNRGPVPEGDGRSTPSFPIRMSEGRRQLLEIAKGVREEQFIGKLDSMVRGWLPPDQRSNAPKVRFVTVDQLDAYYRTLTHKAPPPDLRGFTHFDPRTGEARIFVRRNPSGWLDPVKASVLAHEYFHAYSHPAFRRLGTSIFFGDDSRNNASEGGTQYLTFRTMGPNPYTNREGGYTAYLQANEQGLQATGGLGFKVDGAYALPTMMTEGAVQGMGGTLYRAGQQGGGGYHGLYARLRRAGVSDNPQALGLEAFKLAYFQGDRDALILFGERALNFPNARFTDDPSGSHIAEMFGGSGAPQPGGLTPRNRRQRVADWRHQQTEGIKDLATYWKEAVRSFAIDPYVKRPLEDARDFATYSKEATRTFVVDPYVSFVDRITEGAIDLGNYWRAAARTFVVDPYVRRPLSSVGRHTKGIRDAAVYWKQATRTFAVDPYVVRPLAFVGRKIGPDRAYYTAVVLPVIDAVAHPWMAPQIREDIGNANFAVRGPVLAAIAIGTARGKLNPLTRGGVVLRSAAGSSFAMNAIGNYYGIITDSAGKPPLAIISETAFATAQTFLATRSLKSAHQGRKHARWSGRWKGNTPLAKYNDAQGLKWSVLARKTGVKRAILKQENLPRALVIPDASGNIVVKTKQHRVREKHPTWESVATRIRVPAWALEAANPQITRGRPKTGDYLNVPVTATVPKGTTWKGAKHLVRSLAAKNNLSARSIRDLNGLGKRIAIEQVKVPEYIWERDSQVSRLLQVAGAGSMSTASWTLLPLDYAKWGLYGMGFVPADAGIGIGTGVTAIMTALPNKKKGTLAKRMPKTTATAQTLSAVSLGWKGAGHILAQHGVLGPDMKKRDSI
jgi:hypothetical protein